MAAEIDKPHVVRKVEEETRDVRRYVIAERKEELVYKLSESEIDLLETSIQKIAPPSQLFHTLWAAFFGAFVTALFSVLFASQLSPVATKVGYFVILLSGILTILCFSLDRREGNKLVTSRQDVLDTFRHLKQLYTDPRSSAGNSE